jgi:hypothetical protein
MDDDTDIVRIALPGAGGEDDRVLLVEVRPDTYGGEEEIGTRLPSFETVLETVEVLATAFAETLARVQPRRGSVQLGIDIGMESGQLTALLVKGSAKANFVVKLEWEQ